MASYTFSGSIANNKQGDYNSNGSKSFSNNAIKVNFSSALANFRKAVDVNAITISSAYMYITCTASGKSEKKYFNIRYYGLNLWQNIRSNSVAFDRQTSLTFNNNNILKWIQSGSYIYSYDPQIKESGRTSSSGGRYSENYVKISKAYIVINYTINKTSFINPPSNFDFRINNELTWKPNMLDYTHTITLNPEGTTTSYILLEKNEITDKCISNVSFKVNTENNNQSINFLLPEEIAEKYMTDKTTLKANLSIQTFNSSGQDLGTETKSVNLSINPIYSYNFSIIEENLENLTPWPDEEHLIIIANHTKPKFSIKASSDLGANVVACFYRFEDGQTFKVEKKEDSDIFSCEPFFTNIENTELIVNITLTDSRGINSQEIIAFTGASLLNKSLLNIISLSSNEKIFPLMIYGYQKPEIKNFIIQRYFKQEENKYVLDEFEGKHIKIVPEINNTPIINKKNNPLKYFLKIQDNKDLKIITDWENNAETFLEEDEIFKKIEDINKYLSLAYNDFELLFTLRVYDSLSLDYYSEKTFVLDSAHYLLHFRKGEPSVGIGTAAESIPLDSNGELMLEGLITMGWPVKMKEPLGVEYGGTGVSSYNGIIKNLIKDLLENLMPIGYLFPSVTHPKINNTLSNDFINFLRETYWISVEKHENYTMWKRTNPKEEINYYQNFTYEWTAPEGESLSFKKGSNEISLTNYWDPSSISDDARVMVIINDEEFYGDFNSKFYGLNNTPGGPISLPYMISGLGNFSARDGKETETQTFFIEISEESGTNKTYVDPSKIKIYLSKPVEIKSITIKIVYDYN